MPRFSSKPKPVFDRLRYLRDMDPTAHQPRNTPRMYFGPSVAEVRKKRSAAAKKAAATRKRNKQTDLVVAWQAPVDTSYLDDLREGLHKEWRKAKNDKPVILSCEEVIAAVGGKADLVRSACTGHATDFAEYVWASCPAVYFDEVIKQMAQRIAANGVSYPKVLRDRARNLAFSLEDHR